jgi:hypothetical protein
MSNNDISKYNNILEGVLFNWKEISNDKNTMDVLNMQENKTCQMLRDDNMYQSDSMVQAKSFTLMMWLLSSIHN